MQISEKQKQDRKQRKTENRETGKATILKEEVENAVRMLNHQVSTASQLDSNAWKTRYYRCLIWRMSENMYQ